MQWLCSPLPPLALMTVHYWVQLMHVKHVLMVVPCFLVPSLQHCGLFLAYSWVVASCRLFGKGRNQNCHRTTKGGARYTITCLNCSTDDIKSIYHGETSRTLYSRLKQHVGGLRNKAEDNPLYTNTNMSSTKEARVHLITHNTSSLKIP